MAGEGDGGWPKGEEAKRAIADLANAMQGVAGWIPEMDREELTALATKLTTMTRIVLERLGPALAPSGVWPKAPEVGELLTPPYPRCEYGGGAERCNELGTHRVVWQGVANRGEANVCSDHEHAVLENGARLGLSIAREPRS